MSYEPTEDEKRVIAWLRKRADAAMTGAEQFYCDVHANAIEQGTHHDG